MFWLGSASGLHGHSPKFSDAAIEFCLTTKNSYRYGREQYPAIAQTAQTAQSAGLDAACRSATAKLVCTWLRTTQASSFWVTVKAQENEKARRCTPSPKAQAIHHHGCTATANMVDLRDLG